MGQRFQFYIQYNDGKTLYASHSGWCFGKYAIQRACQLIEFVQKNIREADNYFFGDYAIISRKKAYSALKYLTEINLKDASVVETCDLVKEACDMAGAIATKRTKKGDKILESININPFHQDNNDGIFVLKINSDNTIQYAFDFMEEDGTFVPITAGRYYEKYQDYDYENCDWENKEESHYYEIIEKQIAFISEFNLLSEYELEQIFIRKYKLDDCNIDTFYVFNEEMLSIDGETMVLSDIDDDDYVELPF